MATRPAPRTVELHVPAALVTSLLAAAVGGLLEWLLHHPEAVDTAAGHLGVVGAIAAPILSAALPQLVRVCRQRAGFGAAPAPDPVPDPAAAPSAGARVQEIMQAGGLGGRDVAAAGAAIASTLSDADIGRILGALFARFAAPATLPVPTGIAGASGVAPFDPAVHAPASPPQPGPVAPADNPAGYALDARGQVIL